jgi:hypothetical protein
LRRGAPLVRGFEAEVPTTCPQCGGELLRRCPSCGAGFSSLAVVDCEECGEPVRPNELFGSKISGRRRSEGEPGRERAAHCVRGILLIVFLAVEGATLLNLGALLTVHAFIGMFLLPIVALKLGSTGWRMARYYLGAEEYVRRGPPAFPLRVVVAPVVVASTLVLFGTGVYLLAVHETQGTAVGLHKASFVVWLVATSSTSSRGSRAWRRRCAPDTRGSFRGSGSRPSRSSPAQPWR